jgi:hypothetical protein
MQMGGAAGGLGMQLPVADDAQLASLPVYITI